MKKIMAVVLATLLVLSLTFVLVACIEKPDPTPTPKPGGDVDLTISDESLKNILGTGKLYVTCIGQANDYKQVANVLTAANGLGMDASTITVNNLLTADKVEDGSTVIIAVGNSAKGLGDAGVDAASETKRANDFAAKKDK